MKLWALLAAVWLASLVVVGAWQRADGAAAADARWRERESNELRTANLTILRLYETNRAAEQRHQETMAASAARYQKEMRDAKAKSDRVVADLRRGLIRLRDPGAQGAGGGGRAATGSALGGGDGAQGSQLSGEAAEFLLRLTGEADEVVQQLAACQRELTATYQLCAGRPQDSPAGGGSKGCVDCP